MFYFGQLGFLRFQCPINRQPTVKPRFLVSLNRNWPNQTLKSWISLTVRAGFSGWIGSRNGPTTKGGHIIRPIFGISRLETNLNVMTNHSRILEIWTSSYCLRAYLPLIEGCTLLHKKVTIHCLLRGWSRALSLSFPLPLSLLVRLFHLVCSHPLHIWSLVPLFQSLMKLWAPINNSSFRWLHWGLAFAIIASKKSNVQKSLGLLLFVRRFRSSHQTPTTLPPSPQLEAQVDPTTTLATMMASI